MKITATIQVRMGSSRLPGKVLKKIAGKSILEWQVQRIKNSRLINKIIIATTESIQDDILVQEAKRLNVNFYRGSETDVLKRVHSAFFSTLSDIHVEFYGDSPFVDGLIIDQTIEDLLKHRDEVDFVSNGIKTTFPPGLEVTAYKAFCLDQAEKLTPNNDPSREHVTPNILKLNSVRSKNIEAPKNLNYPEYYFEIDYQEDLSMLNNLIKIVINKYGENFSAEELVRTATENPRILKVNKELHRNWKQFREK